MSTKVDASVLSSGVELLANGAKVVANLTSKKNEEKDNKPTPQTQDQAITNPNQPHTQTVEVKVGSESQKKEGPVILKEKTETHIHKPYPEQRNLTPEECEVEKLRIKTAQENLFREYEFKTDMYERERKERREREEYEREELKRRREERKKRQRRNIILGSIAGAGALGLIAYSLYADYRDSHSDGLPVQEPKASLKITVGNNTGVKIPKSKPIKAEGTVK